jgi:hypothetical protein
MEECERQQDIMSIMTSTTEKYKANGKDTNKEPEKFNGKPTKWKQWKNEFEGHLSQITGSSGDTPLVYITRDDDEITEDEYNELEGPMKKVYDAPLQGYHFDKDNYLVFQKLRNQLSGGLAETHLSDFERSGNGRAAWQHLVTCFEGEDARNAAITAARNDIREATWEKNTRNWTFDMYCLKHVKAHNTLRKYGIIIEGETKVRDFIRGIHNQSLASIKANILLTDRTKNDLDQAIIAFKDNISVLRNPTKTGELDQYSATAAALHEEEIEIRAADKTKRDPFDLVAFLTHATLGMVAEDFNQEGAIVQTEDADSTDVMDIRDAHIIMDPMKMAWALINRC